MVQTAKKSGKNRKYGRQKRSQSAIRYKAENRCARNAAKRLKKHEARCAKKENNPPKTPRGTARSIRRKGMARQDIPAVS